MKYFYDSLNRLTNVTDWASRITSMEYDLANRLKEITRPNGTVRELSYDAAGQTTNIIERAASLPIAFFKMNWNNAARMDWEFTAPLPHAYTPPGRTNTVNDDNQIATFNGNSVTHDSDGNMTYGPLTNATFATYTFDARNRLVGTTSAASLTYGYDPLGNRTSITNGTNITKFVINPNAALSQALIRVKNGVTNYYVYGLGLLYEVNGTDKTKTYHYDARGSTVALTDGLGNVTDRMEYSAYGTTTYRAGTNDTPFLYNGRYGVQTDANGLLYMRARYYNPYLCRFINADPSGFSGGLNLYAYADGNPVSMIDPFGLGAIGASGASWLQQQSWYQGIQNMQADARRYGDGISGQTLAAGALNVVTLGLAGDIAAATTGYDLYNNRVTRQEQIIASVSVGLSLIPLERIGQAGAREATRVSSIAAKTGSAGDHIVLGLRNFGLNDTAAQVGGRTLLRDANRQTTLQTSLGNPSTRFTVSLDGVSGACPYSQFMNAAQQGLGKGAVQDNWFNWEMGQVYQAGRQGRVNFMQGSQVVPNPFH